MSSGLAEPRQLKRTGTQLGYTQELFKNELEGSLIQSFEEAMNLRREADYGLNLIYCLGVGVCQKIAPKSPEFLPESSPMRFRGKVSDGNLSSNSLSSVITFEPFRCARAT